MKYRKKDIIKVNESKKVESAEPDEGSYEEPDIEFVARSSATISNGSGESEEDPEEEFEEDYEGDLKQEPEGNLEEDSEVDPEEEIGEEQEDPEEEIEEEQEDSEEDPEEEIEEEQEDSEEDPEEEIEEEQEDSEEDPEEEIEEEQEDSEEDPEEEIEEEQEDSAEDPEEEIEEEQVDPEEDLSKEPEEDPDLHSSEDDPYEDPSEEDPSGEDVSQQDSERVINRRGHSSSYGKKILRVTQSELSPSQVLESKKKCGYEEAFKPEFAIGSAVSNSESVSERGEPLGKSGKLRRSRWEPQLGQDGELGIQVKNSKRKKTRWDIDDSQLKNPSPLQMPIRKELVHLELDPVVQQLKVKLIEINNKLQASVLQDERPEHERSPSPEPVYNNLGLRVNTHEVRLREKLIKERQRILSKLIIKNSAFEARPPVNKPEKIFKKLYIPVKEYPTYNFVGLILGPRGNTQKRMEKETGAKIHLRGKGAERASQKDDQEDLHVYIEANSQKSLDAAVAMVEKLLVPQNDHLNEHKLAQLKELAKLKGTYRDENFCEVCKEEGHRSYACPQRPSTLKAMISCDACGSFSHPTSTCSSIASSKIINHPVTKKKPEKEIDDTNLYIGFLPKAVDESRLREMFSPFGKIISSVVIKDRNTGASKGYGFVKYENSMDAATAVMHMNKYQMDAHMLVVRVAGPNPQPQVTGFPALAPLPVYAGLYPGVSNHTGWPGQPVSMLPGAQISFLNGNQLPSVGSTNFTPRSFIPGLNESKAAHSSSGSLAQFPGDPDYPGSEFQSYFGTPTL